MLELAAFLNVEASATGRRWLGPTAEQARLGAAIAQATGLPEIVGRILARRGVDPANAPAYLAPALRDLMPDPSSLRDMDRAAERFRRAVKHRERIAVFADYDVDGGAAAALILTWLRQAGHRATLYVPDRIDEGYGPNVPAMAQLGAAHDLVVCVDCGTLSHEPIAAAGCDVIVLDHHLGGEELPPALAVVNPNRQDEAGESRLSLRRGGGVPDAGGGQPADAGRGRHRAGPAVAARSGRAGDGRRRGAARRAQPRAGAAGPDRDGAAGAAGDRGAGRDRGGLPARRRTYGLGFVIGPRINAGGRVGVADLGARLLGDRGRRTRRRRWPRACTA